MTELRQCQTCIYAKETKEAKICTREPKLEMGGKLYHLQSYERNQGSCGISAVYYTEAKPSLEQLNSMFD